MLSDEKICQVVGTVRYRNVDGKMELVPIEERNDERLTIAKDIAKLQTADDYIDFANHWTRKVTSDNKMVFLYDMDEWRERYLKVVNLKKGKSW